MRVAGALIHALFLSVVAFLAIATSGSDLPTPSSVAAIRARGRPTHSFLTTSTRKPSKSVSNGSAHSLSFTRSATCATRTATCTPSTSSTRSASSSTTTAVPSQTQFPISKNPVKIAPASQWLLDPHFKITKTPHHRKFHFTIDARYGEPDGCEFLFIRSQRQSIGTLTRVV